MIYKLTYTLLAATFLSLTCALPVYASSGTTAAGRGIASATAKASGSASTASSSTVSSIGRGLDQATSTLNTAQSGINAGSSLTNTDVSFSGASSAAGNVNTIASSVDKIAGTNVAGSISGTTGKVSQAAGDLSGIQNAVSSVANGNLSLGTASTAASSANTIAGTVDKWAGTNIAGSISGTTGKIGEAASDLSNMQNAYTNIANGDISLSNAESILNSANSFGNTLDKWTGSNISSSITGLTGDANKAIGSIQGTMNSVSDIGGTIKGMINQGESLVNFVSDPQQLTQMAMNMAWSQVETVAMNVAEDLVMSLFSTPGTGIPVTAPVVTTQKTLAQVQKKLTGELEDDIAKEKDKILEAMGGKPAVAANPQTGTQQTDSAQEENPARENCPAYMAQFKPITNLAFDFVNENMIKDIKNEKLGKVQTNWDEAVKYVKSTFYHDNPTTLTPEITRDLGKKRQDYLHEVNSNILSVSIGMQQALIEDAKSISTAPTSGCGFIDDVNINTQTMIALVKQTMAEIALEIRLFELEAIKEQTKHPIELLPKPEDLSLSSDELDKEVSSALDSFNDALNPGESSSAGLTPSSSDAANKGVGYYTGGPIDANNPAEPKE